jgi:hypothetical protein
MTTAQISILSKFEDEQTKKAIQEIAETITPLLDEVHAQPPTTENYYGDYMMIISHSPKKTAGGFKLLAIAMLYAGANPQGIQAAIKNIC